MSLVGRCTCSNTYVCVYMCVHISCVCVYNVCVCVYNMCVCVYNMRGCVYNMCAHVSMCVYIWYIHDICK